MNVNKYRLCIYRMHLLFFSVIKIDDAHTQDMMKGIIGVHFCVHQKLSILMYILYIYQ